MIKNPKMPPELKGLKLANRLQSSENLDVDIIIGNDYYGQLITGKIIKTENIALIAMESKFGWLLSGGTSIFTKAFCITFPTFLFLKQTA